MENTNMNNIVSVLISCGAYGDSIKEVPILLEEQIEKEIKLRGLKPKIDFTKDYIKNGGEVEVGKRDIYITNPQKHSCNLRRLRKPEGSYTLDLGVGGWKLRENSDLYRVVQPRHNNYEKKNPISSVDLENLKLGKDGIRILNTIIDHIELSRKFPESYKKVRDLCFRKDSGCILYT
jgi:hypothetical protein